MSESDGGRGGFSFPPSGPSGGGGDTVGPASSTDNTLVRFDGTTGKLLQGSLVVVDDAGVLSGATQANVDSLRLDGNVISSQDLNGAITLDPNGSGPIQFISQFIALGGTTSSFGGISLPGAVGIISLRNGDDSGFAIVNMDRARAINGTTVVAVLGTSGLELGSSGTVGASSTSDATASKDTGQTRVSAGVWKDTDGGGGGGWRQWAGESYLAANATNATAALATTGLSVTVKGGRKYSFKCILYLSDSTAAEGAQVDFGGGSATATNFRAHVTGFDTAPTINTQVTTLTTPASAGTFTGAGMIEVHGSLEPSSDGTFAPRFAQNTHAVGTLTLFRGSHLLMWDMP